MAGPEGVPSERFATAYEGRPPWDIDGPQPALAEVADRVSGTLLDVGCGTGENALFFASRGLQTLGVDFVPAAIRIARQRATERKLASARFEVCDALDLRPLGRTFDAVIDSGLFHVFSDAQRKLFLASLSRVLRPGGDYLMLCFSDKMPGVEGPRRVTEAELRACFGGGWSVRELVPVTFEVREAGSRPLAWRLHAGRLG